MAAAYTISHSLLIIFFLSSSEGSIANYTGGASAKMMSTLNSRAYAALNAAKVCGGWADVWYQYSGGAIHSGMCTGGAIHSGMCIHVAENGLRWLAGAVNGMVYCGVTHTGV